MADLTPKLNLRRPIPNVELNWAFRLNETIDLLDDAVLTANLTGEGQVTITDDGSGNVTISGLVLTFSGVEGVKPYFDPASGLVTVSGFSGTTFEPTGFTNLTESTVSFDGNSRTFSIYPTTTGTAFEYWIKGEQYFVGNTLEVQISNDDGLHAIYINEAGNLVDDTTITVDEIIKENAYVALLSWDSTNQNLSLFGEERHGLTMDWATHAYLHTIEGTRYVSGLDAGNFTTTGDGSDNSHAHLSIADGVIADEDLNHSITHAASPSNPFEQILDPVAEIPVLYRSGVTGVWTRDAATPFPVKSGTGTIQYNEFTGATWQTTDIDDGDYGYAWIFGTHDRQEPVIAVLGQDTTGPLAYFLGVREDFDELELDNFPIPEARILWRVSFEADSAYTNGLSAAIREVTDLRQVPLAAVAGTTTTHGSLSGLLEDDHPQYVIGDASRESAATLVTSGTFEGVVTSSGIVQDRLNAPVVSGTPIDLNDGDVWINSATNELAFRVNGTTVTVGG